MIDRIAPTPKILMVSSTRGFVGGVERLMVQIASALKSENWFVYGLFEQTARIDPGFDGVFDDIDMLGGDNLQDLISDYIELGIDIVCLNKTTNYTLVQALQDRFPTVVIVHDHDYYCIRRHKYFIYKRKNCYLPFSRIYCLLCAGLVERREPGWGVIDAGQRFKLLDRIRKCDLSFVLSDYMKNNLLMNHWKADSVCKLLPYQPVAAEGPVKINEIPMVLFVGQLIRGKGVDLLLEALSQIEIPFKCKILGRGNDEAFLKRLARKLKLEESVEFLGWADDVSAIYAQADLVVVPSRWQEPFGLVGLEAFAHKKAVVAFDIGGISEWLKHKVNGLLVKPEDVKRLARAISSLLQDDELRCHYSEAGYSFVETHYGYEQFKTSLIEPMIGLIQSRSRRSHE